MPLAPLDTTSPDSYDDYGTKPVVDEDTLKTDGRVINTTSQAYQVANTIIYDSRLIVAKAAKITAKVNGAPPRSHAELKEKGQSWRSNVSTGALATTISKIAPRLWQPVKTARYLISSSLPEGTANGNHKTEYFRRIVTDAIRSWRKWPFFIQSLANEVGRYGVGYPTFFDKYDWRPAMLRMDRGFVPVGAEIMDDNLGFYVYKWDYRPGDLLQLLKDNQEAGLDDWNKDNVVAAINSATVPSKSVLEQNLRSYEDLVRNGTAWLNYTKGVRLVQTVNLLVEEMDGKVSHYILLSDNEGGAYGRGALPPEESRSGLLYQKLDRYESMRDAVIPVVFEYGNGTIHGSQGAGHILYDMAVQLELSRNESFDNLKMTNRIKLQVPDAKDVNQVKTIVQDLQVIVSGAQYAGAQAGLSTNVEGYIALDQQMSKLMEEKVGAFLPPYSVPGSSPTATQVNVATAREEEVRNAILDNWLTQLSLVVHAMMRRLTDKASDDKVAKKTREKLLEVLEPEELDQLRDNPPNSSILEFTEFISQRKAAFCQSVRGNPYYDQFQVEQTISEAQVGQEVSSVILPPGEDQNKVAEAARQQILELTSIGQGAPVPVVQTDNHYIHMQVMKPWVSTALQQASGGDMSKMPGIASAIPHYEQHYTIGVEQKVIPKNAINEEKGLIASWKKTVASIQRKAQEAAKLQAVQAGQAAVASGDPRQAIRAIEATGGPTGQSEQTNEQTPLTGGAPGGPPIS